MATDSRDGGKLMKLLSRKSCDKILKKIAAIQIICNAYIDDIEAITKMIDHLADIAIEIGGCKGTKKMLNTVTRYEH